MTNHNTKIGQWGEKIALQYLKKQNYKILEKNYRQKWGEIDIIAQERKNKNLLIFIEVKTILTLNFNQNAFRKPEDQITFSKLNHLKKSILAYLNHNKIDSDYRLDLIAIEINLKTKKYQLRHFKGIE